MFLRRIANALRRQDWAVISIEFVMVISGVLIALQLDQWSQRRALDALEIKYFKAVREDIKRNISDIGDAVKTLNTVTRFGYDALNTIKTKKCKSHCWPEVAAFFHASQWIDSRLNDTSFEEMKRAGFPRDAELREQLNHYHDLFAQTTVLNSELPEYRELARSIIPAKMQAHMWAHCFSFSGRNQTIIVDCPSPEDLSEVKQTFEKLVSTPNIETTLTFWMSTVHLQTMAMSQDSDEPRQIIESLTKLIGDE